MISATDLLIRRCLYRADVLTANLHSQQWKVKSPIFPLRK
jgi:hypothetical protein